MHRLALRPIAASLVLMASLLVGGHDWGRQPAFAQQAAPAATLAKPQWQKGDTWQIETVTEKIQGREKESAGTTARIRWKFKVAENEKVSNRDCWRIDIECLAKGRLKPASAIWVDQETLFLRQFQTQLPVAGTMRTIQETYEPGAAGHSPVLPPVNVLPVSLPAFLAAAPKGEFKYTSRPTVQSKDIAGSLRFAHSVTQDVKPASAKSLEFVPRALSKSLEKTPAVEVHLGSGEQQVMQVWQPKQPWPVYSNNGHTQSWLVVEPAGAGGNK